MAWMAMHVHTQSGVACELWAYFDTLLVITGWVMTMEAVVGQVVNPVNRQILIVLIVTTIMAMPRFRRVMFLPASDVLEINAEQN